MADFLDEIRHQGGLSCGTQLAHTHGYKFLSTFILLKPDKKNTPLLFLGIPADANVLAAVGLPGPPVAWFSGVPAVDSVPAFAGFPAVAIVSLLLLAS
jgi:hypothetical protein